MKKTWIVAATVLSMAVLASCGGKQEMEGAGKGTEAQAEKQGESKVEKQGEDTKSIFRTVEEIKKSGVMQKESRRISA